MKNIIRTIAISACVTFMLQGCDSYLDIEPKGRVQLESTEDYLGLIEGASQNYEHYDGWYISNEASWYKVMELKNYTAPMRSAGFLWDEDYDRTLIFLTSNLYNDCYSRITNYNVIVSNVMQSKGSDEDKRVAMAQAKIMRAYNYFFLVNTFAKPYDPATADSENGVIVREKMFESIEEKGVQQTVGYTYRFIQQDIEDALPDLPDMAPNAFRPDKTFGYALKAKVHLFKREFDQCIDACLAALAEAPAGNHEMWNMNTEYNRYSPSLLRAYGTDRAIDRPEYMGVNDAIESIWKNGVAKGYDSPENLIYLFGSTDTDPFPMYLTKDVIDLFEEGADLRELYCIRYRRTHETAPEGDREFATMGVKWNPAGIRLSEVYLMLAECYARKGTTADIAKAMEYLDVVRSNRCITGKYTKLNTSDADEAMRFVREERKRELFLTCNGFFDLRRFCTEFNETLTKEFDGQTYTLSPKSTLLTFPFPMKAMQTSDLKQNSK